jgi:hypothetical protein
MLMREGDKPFGLKSKENELLPRILLSGTQASLMQSLAAAQ